MKLRSLLFAGLFFSGLLIARSPVPPAEAAGLTCIDDYYSFILTVRSENLRSETAKDIFTLGYCQLNDIMTLDDELDALKENFRTAASACNSTTAYKEEYERILMEMYFVRHLQGGQVLSSLDETQIETLKEEKLALMKAEMKAIFVDEEERVDEDTFDSYFDTWSQKYDERIEDYKRCEEGPWAELSVTWADFVETLQEIDFEVEVDKGKSLKEILVPDVEVDVDQDMTALGNSVKNAWEYLKTIKDKKKTEVEDPETIAELGSTGGSMTFEQAFTSLQASQDVYNAQSRSADRLSRYTLLYGAGGSVQATNLQSTVSTLNTLLQEMNTKDLPSIAANSAKVSDKQCN